MIACTTMLGQVLSLFIHLSICFYCMSVWWRKHLESTQPEKPCS